MPLSETVDLGEYEVAADVPGRLRVRLLHCSDAGGALARVTEILRATDGVYAVRAARATCSVVVAYDRNATGVDNQLRALDELGYKPRAASIVRGRPRLGRAAQSVAGAVPSTSRHIMDSGLAGPMVLGVFSARQLLRYGPQLRRAPWHTLAWYAYNVYASRRTVHSQDSRDEPMP